MAASWRTAVCLSLIALFSQFAAAAARAETPPPAKPPSAEAALATVSLDPAAAARSYRVRNWIRSRVVSASDLDKYCLRFDENWQTAAPGKPLVVLVHGFNSTPARNADLLVPVREASFPCATFAYPNDYLLPAAAELLSQKLRAVGCEYPNRRVVLVCHSTGGLVARACLEDPALDPGNVDRLIMIAPPTHGSQLARIACGTDVWEHWLARKEGWPWTRVRDSIIDGLGEAADELCPESDFLTQLNARPRNPRVRYTIFLGTKSVVTDAEFVWIHENVCDRLKKMPGVDDEKLDALLADVDELLDGKGDGVVAVKRGRLDGVEDTVLMPFGHMAVGGKTRDKELDALYSAIITRLQ